jgi:hypothetical protein
MSDAEGRWLTYEELGQLTGRTPNGARMFASRRNWPKRSSNRIGERATVLVPTEIAETPSRASHDAERAKVAPLANGTDERAIARAAIDALTEQLAIANRRLDEERQRSDGERTCSARAMERAATEISDVRRELSDATAAERIARDEAAGLRAELDARKQWGLWRRLRGR